MNKTLTLNPLNSEQFCLDFIKTAAGSYLPLIENPQKIPAAALQKKEKDNTDPGFGFDLFGEEALVNVIREYRFSGLVYSEEKGWAQYKNGEEEQSPPTEIFNQPIIIVDPFDGSSAFAKKCGISSSKDFDNFPENSPYLQNQGTAITYYDKTSETLISVVVDYQLRTIFNAKIINGIKSIQIYDIRKDGKPHLVEDTIIQPLSVGQEKTTTIASNFFKKNRFEHWKQLPEEIRSQFSIVKTNLGIDGLVDWLRGRFHLAIDIGKGSPWYELAPWLTFINSLDGQIYINHEERIKPLTIEALIESGYKNNNSRFKFVAGKGDVEQKAEILLPLSKK